MIGWAPDHKEIRHWKVDRIEEAEVTQMPFQRPENFDLAGHLAKSFGVFHGDGDVHVRIRFSPTVARYVQESNWHPSQKITTQENGSLLAEFDLDGTEEIKRWVMSFGRHAEVLEPERLREDIVSETEAMLREYSREPSVEVRHE